MTDAPYDAIAGWYAGFITRPLFTDLVHPAVLSLVGEVAGLRILDLACGQGHLARELAAHGAIVTGVDLSEGMLAIAREAEEATPLGIQYVLEDAASLCSLPESAFEGVLCVMALMDMPDLDAVLHAVRRVLKPGGWFVFAITHPCFQTPRSASVATERGMVRTVAGYFEEGFWRSSNPDGVCGRVGAHHRTLGTYLNALIDAGFTLERMIEPQASARVAADFPGYEIVPGILAARCVDEESCLRQRGTSGTGARRRVSRVIPR